MALVTVITPTYNRASELFNLFESLQHQTSFDFEWLIVDDGSTDCTREQVNKFIEQANFNVWYVYKKNGGKHTALNVGIKQVKTELVFIVDSDDTVTPDGIETISYYYEKYKSEPNLGAFSFLREHRTDGILLKMPVDEFVGSYIEERIRHDRPGDMAEVYFTKALRETPFPEFEGEKFLSEDVVWIAIGLKYKMVFVNKVIYQFEYLQDGLTKNDKRSKFASPLGSMMRGKMLMKKECGLKAKIRGAIIYGCYKREVTKEIPACVKLESMADRMLVSLLWSANLLFHKQWKG